MKLWWKKLVKNCTTCKMGFDTRFARRSTWYLLSHDHTCLKTQRSQTGHKVPFFVTDPAGIGNLYFRHILEHCMCQKWKEEHGKALTQTQGFERHNLQSLVLLLMKETLTLMWFKPTARCCARGKKLCSWERSFTPPKAADLNDIITGQCPTPLPSSMKVISKEVEAATRRPRSFCPRLIVFSSRYHLG